MTPPTGSVTVAQVKVFGSVPTEKAVGYPASMLRAMACGLTRPFHNLLRAQGAMYRDVSGLEWHEGGASGVIRGKEVPEETFTPDTIITGENVEDYLPHGEELSNWQMGGEIGDVSDYMKEFVKMGEAL